MGTTRVTLTLDRRIVEETRAHGGENLGRLVNNLLVDRLDALRRMQLQEELRLGYLAEADTDLEIVHEFRHIYHEPDLADSL